MPWRAYSGARQVRQGRLSTLIELGVGFDTDMAARDNVVIDGIMLGLSRRGEARETVRERDEIAELQEFEDLKLKNYSWACRSAWRSRWRSRSMRTF